MQTKISSWRQNKKIRIGVIVFLMLLLVVLYFRNVDTDKIVTIEGAGGELKQQLVPDTWEKKIFLGMFGILGAALGMEVAEYDLDLGKLVKTNGDLKSSKVLRDKTGNVVTEEQIKSGAVNPENVKYTDEYNCSDFSTQVAAQTFYDNAGGVQNDINRLDGNKDGIACQALPKN